MDLYRTFISTTYTYQLVPVPPVNENLILMFISHCVRQGLSYTSIKLYLCGLRFFYLTHLGYNPLEISPGQISHRITHALTGLKKTQTPQHKLVRQPITFDILSIICETLKSNLFDHFTNIMMEAACTLAFFAFLRCGEFTVNTSSQFDHSINLCHGDITIQPNSMTVLLKKSKTDPARLGVSIPIFQTDKHICPVKAMRTYLSHKSHQTLPDDPLFIDKNSQALTRNHFISLLRTVLNKQGINASNFHGHSFRIGAATTAAKVRMEDHLIKTLGRWSSDCYTRYIHTPSNVIKAAQLSLTHT